MQMWTTAAGNPPTGWHGHLLHPLSFGLLEFCLYLLLIFKDHTWDSECPINKEINKSRSDRGLGNHPQSCVAEMPTKLFFLLNTQLSLPSPRESKEQGGALTVLHQELSLPVWCVSLSLNHWMLTPWILEGLSPETYSVERKESTF